MTSLAHPHLMIIGRSEPITFVGYEQLAALPAKIDTGAYRSAIHAEKIHFDKEGHLHFTLFANHPVCKNCATEIVTDKFSKASVSNSFGDTEERYEVVLKVKIGPKVFNGHFTLANRAKKIYPILIGRQLLNGRFLVDSSFSSISRQQLKAKYNITLPDDEEDGGADGGDGEI